MRSGEPPRNSPQSISSSSMSEVQVGTKLQRVEAIVLTNKAVCIHTLKKRTCARTQPGSHRDITTDIASRGMSEGDGLRVVHMWRWLDGNAYSACLRRRAERVADLVLSHGDGH